MYDFYLGSKQEIFENEKDTLVSIKRMMPRWCNGIPDSEFLAIYDDLMNSNVVNPDSKGVMIETGSGASTIMLVYFAYKYNKQVYTWDTNQNKLAYLRSIILDTLEKTFQQSMHNVWKFVPFYSTSPDLGISILKETNQQIDFAFFDSEHTSEVLMAEVELVAQNCNNHAILALDDANYRYKYKNTAYINIFRKKLGLPVIENPEDNVTDTFVQLVETYLQETYPKSVQLEDSYKANFKDDIFWDYFSNDRNIMANLGMEKLENLSHRYDSFKIIK